MAAKEGIVRNYQRRLKQATLDLESLVKHYDELYIDYKKRLEKPIKGLLPSKREDFDICSPKYVRKYIKYIPKDKVSREQYLSDMLNVCTFCAECPEGD